MTVGKNKEAGNKNENNNSDELAEKYMRALADYQNLLKQVERDKVDFAKYAAEKLIREFLPIYDYLKISLAHAGVDNEWVAGVNHVLTEFKKVLEKSGVAEIKTVGAKFDPQIMEALATENTNEPEQDDMVAKEVKAGYMIHNRVLSPATVIVYKLTSSKVES